MKRLYLSKTDSKICGVCGGIGQTYDLDPTVIRLALILLCFATAILPVVITYIIAWAIIPEKPAE